MRKVTHYINERFSEESDPVHDMGIGIAEQIKKFMKNDIEEYQDDGDALTTHKDTILGYCIAYNKEDFVDYLISKGANINNKYVAFRTGLSDISVVI